MADLLMGKHRVFNLETLCVAVYPGIGAFFCHMLYSTHRVVFQLTFN